MTGDTTPISDEARQAAAKALLDEGGGPGNGLHSWRCEHPDRYGPCDCVQEVADLILAAAAPLLVSADSSAQAERLRRERDRWEDEAKGWERHLIAAEVVVEGLRAELTEAHHNAADEIRREARWQESLRVRGNSGPSWQQSIDRLLAVEQIIRSRSAALRAAGGQEKPNDATPQLANCTTCGATDAECRTVMGQTGAVRSCCARCKMTDTHPAAPVGGQAEPSDAAKHTIAWTLDANRGCIEGRITCHAGPGDPCHRACRCEDASCYCGGATMEDIDFCNPLAFIEDEDDVSLIERYDGADETLRDGPVELVWMPDGETYGWRYAAAAVSGEHQDATEDAQ